MPRPSECLIMSYNENVKKNVAFKHDKASQYFFKLMLLSISDKNQKNNSHKTLGTLQKLRSPGLLFVMSLKDVQSQSKKEEIM